MIINALDYAKKGTGEIDVQAAFDVARDGEVVIVPTLALGGCPDGGWLVAKQVLVIVNDLETPESRYIVLSSAQERWDARTLGQGGSLPEKDATC